MLIFKALHILTMFAAVTFLLGESTFLAVAVWRGDIRAVAAMSRFAGKRPIIGASIFLVGIAFGLLAVATGGLDFFAGWLVVAYVLVVILLGLSALPVIQKGLVGIYTMAVESEGGQRPAEDVTREMARRRRGIALVVAANWILFGLIILDMVLKPF